MKAALHTRAREKVAPREEKGEGSTTPKFLTITEVNNTFVHYFNNILSTL